MRNLFDVEINYIHDERIKDAAHKLVDMLPDYFFIEPAASTGKYHPKCSNVEGGLMHHTKLAVRFAHEFLSNGSLFNNFNKHDQDMIYLALIMHDGLKYGNPKERYVRFDHSILAAEFVRDNGESTGLTKEECDELYDLIASHMGEFNTSRYSNVVLPLPKTAKQKFIHLCDDISSKQFFDCEFDENHNLVK